MLPGPGKERLSGPEEDTSAQEEGPRKSPGPLAGASLGRERMWLDHFPLTKWEGKKRRGGWEATFLIHGWQNGRTEQRFPAPAAASCVRSSATYDKEPEGYLETRSPAW